VNCVKRPSGNSRTSRRWAVVSKCKNVLLNSRTESTGTWHTYFSGSEFVGVSFANIYPRELVTSKKLFSWDIGFECRSHSFHMHWTWSLANRTLNKLQLMENHSAGSLLAGSFIAGTFRAELLASGTSINPCLYLKLWSRNIAVKCTWERGAVTYSPLRCGLS
jgi:hypothetical protein